MKDSKTTLVLVALLVVAAFAVGSMWTKIRLSDEGKTQVAEGEKQEVAKTNEERQVLGEETLEETGLGGFVALKEEVCKEGEKPLVYYFGSSSCPHCSWEHPVMTEVMKDFSDLVAFHDNMDKQADVDVFTKYSAINNGGIPFIVMGCQYAQIGSGERWGEEEETKNLQAVLCKLTEGKPEAVCGKVKDYIEKL